LFWSERHLFLFGDILRKTSFKLYKIVVWHYPNILKGFSNKKWHNTYDFIFHLVTGEKPKTFNASFADGENKDVWVFPRPQSNFKKDKTLHPTQKPLELVKRIVKMFSNEGEIVLDPFLGSGTTMVACKELKRNCIGIEINPEYIQIAKTRLNWGSSLLNDIKWEFKTFQNKNNTDNLLDVIQA
jgi:site-specific DNA-methyltransferase (adenine-specific)